MKTFTKILIGCAVFAVASGVCADCGFPGTAIALGAAAFAAFMMAPMIAEIIDDKR